MSRVRITYRALFILLIASGGLHGGTSQAAIYQSEAFPAAATPRSSSCNAAIVDIESITSILKEHSVSWEIYAQILGGKSGWLVMSTEGLATVAQDFLSTARELDSFSSRTPEGRAYSKARVMLGYGLGQMMGEISSAHTLGDRFAIVNLYSGPLTELQLEVDDALGRVAILCHASSITISDNGSVSIDNSPDSSPATSATPMVDPFTPNSISNPETAVNLRDEPTTDSNVIVVLDDSTPLKLTGRSQTDEGGTLWVEVEIRTGDKGWIRESDTVRLD